MPHPQSHASTCPTASGMPLGLNAHLWTGSPGTPPQGNTHPFLKPLWPSPYPHVPVAELGLIQGKAEPAVTEHRAWSPWDRSIFAAAGTSRGRLGAGGTAGGQQEGSALGPPPPSPTRSICPALGTWVGNQQSGH